MPEEAQPGRSGATPTVTVRGHAVVRAEPDEAMLGITLSALGETPASALGDVSRRSAALVALLDELEIAKRDRSTTGITVHEEFDYPKAGRRSLGHRAAARVIVRVTDPDMIGRVVTRATTQLEAEIDGPQWEISQKHPVRLTAASEAAADGRRKAAAYAEGVGVRVGRLIGLAEPFTHPPVIRAREGPTAVASAAPELMPIEQGEHEVAAAIEVTFALEVD